MMLSLRRTLVLLNSYSAMNTELWNKILAFDFDSPPGEYSFSIRLANENYWTTNFAKQAILEYKKFMYLAVIQNSWFRHQKL
jgi:hypothetical protein